jgi:hypothetical protein
MRRSACCALAIATLVVGWRAGMPAQVTIRQTTGTTTTVSTPESPQDIAIGDGTAAITGAVLDAASGKPIPGAVVAINGAAAPAGRGVARGFRQIADEHGRFAFTLLPAGGYGISASKFGYFDGGYGRTAVSNSSRRITLVDGQWFRDANVELRRPSAIAGTVVDETGEPLVGVPVRVCAEVFVAGVRQLASGPTATTDDRGIYRIGNLPAGKYIVAVLSVQHAVPAGTSLMDLSGTTAAALASAEAAGRPLPLRRDPALPLDPAHRLIVGPYPAPPPLTAGGRPQAYPLTFYPAARTLLEAEAIELRAGEERQAVNLQMRPVPTFTVSGRIDGPPDASGGMTLRLMPAGSERLGQGNEAATALVADDGSFTFLNVPNGSYVLIASGSIAEYTFRPIFTVSMNPPSPPGYRMASMTSSAVMSGPQGTMFTDHAGAGNARFQGRTPVDVDGRDVDDLVVTLHGGATLSGRVVFELSKPREGMRRGVGIIRAEPANGDPGLGQPRWMRRGAEPEDEFTIEGLRPGQYLLRGLAGPAIKSIVWNGKDYTYTPFDASGGQDITGVVLTFTDQAGTISGTVRDAGGQPATDAAVIYFPAEPAQWTNYGVQPLRLRATMASTTGEYTLRSLPAGDYLLIAVDSELADAWKDPAFLEAASRLATRLSIDWTETKTQDLVLRQVK